MISALPSSSEQSWSVASRCRPLSASALAQLLAAMPEKGARSASGSTRPSSAASSSALAARCWAEAGRRWEQRERVGRASLANVRKHASSAGPARTRHRLDGHQRRAVGVHKLGQRRGLARRPPPLQVAHPLLGGGARGRGIPWPPSQPEPASPPTRPQNIRPAAEQHCPAHLEGLCQVGALHVQRALQPHLLRRSRARHERRRVVAGAARAAATPACSHSGAWPSGHATRRSGQASRGGPCTRVAAGHRRAHLLLHQAALRQPGIRLDRSPPPSRARPRRRRGLKRRHRLLVRPAGGAAKRRASDTHGRCHDSSLLARRARPTALSAAAGAAAGAAGRPPPGARPPERALEALPAGVDLPLGARRAAAHLLAGRPQVGHQRLHRLDGRLQPLRHLWGRYMRARQARAVGSACSGAGGTAASSAAVMQAQPSSCLAGARASAGARLDPRTELCAAPASCGSADARSMAARRLGPSASPLRRSVATELRARAYAASACPKACRVSHGSRGLGTDESALQRQACRWPG